MTTSPATTVDPFARLLAAAPEQDQVELRLVHNGRIQAMAAYRSQPGKDTKSDWDAARLAYDETVARLTARCFPEEAPALEGERFANRKQALNWLQAQGYKVSQGKFYQDVAAGAPALHRDGTVSRYAVMQYGQQLDIETRGGLLTFGSNAEDEARKIKADADIACMKAARMQRDEDRYWLHADEAWATVAALVGTLRDAIRHHLHEGAREIVHLAGGDQNRSQEVFEGCDQLVAKAFNETAGAEINVEFVREVE